MIRGFPATFDRKKAKAVLRGKQGKVNCRKKAKNGFKRERARFKEEKIRLIAANLTYAANCQS